MRSVAAFIVIVLVWPLQPPCQHDCDCTAKFIIGTEAVVGENVYFFLSVVIFSATPFMNIEVFNLESLFRTGKFYSPICRTFLNR